MGSSLKDGLLTYSKSQVDPNDIYGVPISSRCMWTGPTGLQYLQQWSRGDQTTLSYRINYPLVGSVTGIRLLYVNKGIQPSTGAGSECGFDQTVNASSMANGFALSTFANWVVDGSVNTRISSVSYTPTTNDIGRNIHITAGAGWSTGNYTIVSITGSAINLVTPGTATPASPGAVGITGGTGILSGPGTFNVRSTIMWGGSLFPITFNGGRSVALDYGAFAWTDLCSGDFDISQANSVTIVNSVTAAADVCHPTGMMSTSGLNPSEGISIGNDDTSATQSWRGAYAAGQFLFHPWLVNGFPAVRNWPVLIPLQADSIAVGSQDQYVNGTQLTTRTNDRSFIDVANTGIQSITVSGGGSAYTAATVATVTGANGYGCVLGAPVIAAGVITSIPVLTMGFAYDTAITAATVNITDSGGGTGATATAVLGPNFAVVKLARQGDGWASGAFAPTSPAAQMSKTMQRLNIFNLVAPGWVICNHSSNDIFGSSVSAANCEISLKKFIAYAHRAGCKIIVTTVPPRPSATSDAWATAVNQTINATPEAVRLTYNTDLRANWQAWGIDVFWDVCTGVEGNAVGNGTPTLAGQNWVCTGSARVRTPDGIHPSHDCNNFIAANNCPMGAIGVI